MEFKLLENLIFVNVDTEYLQKLHNISNEVYFNKNNYDNKHYIGVLLSKGNYQYVVLLTSSKEKHKKWKDEENDILSEKMYKDLLNKEYRFCVSRIDKLLKKANYAYEKQTKTKKGLKFCCEFKAIEKFVDQYKV